MANSKAERGRQEFQDREDSGKKRDSRTHGGSSMGAMYLNTLLALTYVIR